MRIRPYRPEDDPAILAFSRACASSDPTLRPLSPDGWREFVARPEHDAGRGFAVAVDEDGAQVGLLYSGRIDDDPPLRHFRIFVHPAARRRGIGSALLAHVDSLDPPGSVLAQCNCRETWKAGEAFLRRSGFSRHETSLDMLREEGPAPAVPRVDGVRLRTYDGSARDDAAWIALSEEGYRGTPGYTPSTPEALAQERARAGFHLWLAEKDDAQGGIVGLCMTSTPEDEPARVESVVVAARERGRGLGAALTAAGVRTLLARGPRAVVLNVRAGNEPAVRIYRALGFRTAEAVGTWRRGVHPRSGGP